ncbi:MAG TPA: dienelactone hydrolase family protein [Methylomirabilota bacterium]|nr:dienelactone hydrolase family protein [Methylomirabilota bacterium]
MANPLSRREVLKFGAFTTVGGVLTPGISLAQAITTDGKGIATRDVQVPVGGATIPGYDVRPEAAGRYPIVLVISGFTGNSELYSREGGMQGKSVQEMAQISSTVTSAQYLGDIRATADWARQQTRARADRLGVTGLLGGGALTLHTAAEYPRITAAVPWYGHVKRTCSDAPGVDAFSLASRITMPVLGLYGEADTGRRSTSRKRPRTRAPRSGLLRQAPEILTTGRFAVRLAHSAPRNPYARRQRRLEETDDAEPYPSPAEPP